MNVTVCEKAWQPRGLSTCTFDKAIIVGPELEIHIRDVNPSLEFPYVSHLLCYRLAYYLISLGAVQLTTVR